MCYSAEVSATTFLIGIGGAAYIFFGMGTTADKLVGVFLAFVALMQGIEYLLWMTQDCGDAHKIVSYAGMWLSHLQPVVLGGLALLFGPPRYRLWILGVVGAYLAAAIPYSMQYDNIGDMRCSVPRAENPHLVWNWISMPYCREMYIIFLLAFTALFMMGLPAGLNWRMAAISVGTFTASYLIYPREILGAMWCFFAAFVPITYIVSRRLWL
jgi:hypothetical protein